MLVQNTPPIQELKKFDSHFIYIGFAGARKLVAGGSGHVWNREFERVSVSVDLGNFADVPIVWK